VTHPQFGVRVAGGTLAVSKSTRALVAVLVVALIGVVVSVFAFRRPTAPAAAASAGITASPTASPALTPSPAPLDVKLRRLTGRGPDGIVRARTLRQPADDLEQTFADLYDVAFVDPSAWDEGRFPGLDRFFEGDRRRAMRDDLNELSLGKLAGDLDSVAPGRARLEVRFVTDRGDHPVVAFASMDFRARGDAGGVDVPIRQSARYALERTHGAWRISSWDVSAEIPSSASVKAKMRTARSVPQPPGGDPLFVLVIGSDARPDQSVMSTRADSLHIVSVNPRLGRGAIVGIPRDSYVPIPGHGMSKINAALFYGGPNLVVRTVEDLTGVHVDAYLLTGFDGFHRAVDAIGGLDLRVPYAMNDANSGAHFRPGRTHLNGREALSFSRDRHDVPGGDLGRSMNQGRVLLATLQRLRDELDKDPERLSSWLVGALRFARTDLSLSQMTELLLAASAFEPGRIHNEVAWGSGATVGGQSIVRLGSRATALFRDVARDGVIGH